MGLVRTATPQRSFGRRTTGLDSVSPAAPQSLEATFAETVPVETAPPEDMAQPAEAEQAPEQATKAAADDVPPPVHRMQTALERAIGAPAPHSVRGKVRVVEASVTQIGDVMSQTFALIARNAVTFVMLVVAAAAPERLIWLVTGSGVADFVQPLITTLSSIALYAAVFDGASRSLNGEPVSVGASLRAVRKARAAFGSIATTVVAAWLALPLLSLAKATRLAVAAPAAIAEGLGMGAARARSTVLTEPCRADVQSLVLALAGLAMSRVFLMLPAIGLSSPGDLLGFLLCNWLFPLLFTVIAATGGAVLYRELAGGAPVAVTATA